MIISTAALELGNVRPYSTRKKKKTKDTKSVSFVQRD